MSFRQRSRDRRAKSPCTCETGSGDRQIAGPVNGLYIEAVDRACDLPITGSRFTRARRLRAPVARALAKTHRPIPSTGQPARLLPCSSRVGRPGCGHPVARSAPGGPAIREARVGSPRALVILLTAVLVSAQHLAGFCWLQLRAWRCRNRRTSRDRRRHRASILLRRLLGHSELRSGKAAGRAESRPRRSEQPTYKGPLRQCGSEHPEPESPVVSRCAFAVAQTGPPRQRRLPPPSTNRTDDHED